MDRFIEKAGNLSCQERLNHVQELGLADVGLDVPRRKIAKLVNRVSEIVAGTAIHKTEPKIPTGKYEGLTGGIFNDTPETVVGELRIGMHALCPVNCFPKTV